MAKVLKSQIIKGLTKIGGIINANAEIQAEIDYIVGEYNENDRNVTMEDLKPLIGKIEKFSKKGFGVLLAEAEGTVKGAPIVEVEKSVKTEKKPLKKKEDKKEEAPKEEPKTTTKKEEKPKEKTETSAKVTKGSVVETVPDSSLVAKFPETIQSTSLKANLKARPDLKTIKDISDAFANEVDFVIATYWTRRLLKQYADSYDPMKINPKRPTSFENDLDLIEVTYANELVVTGVSLYSSIPQIFVPSDFEADEESGLRFANGVEFEVYEIVE